MGAREPGALAAPGEIALCVPHLAGNEWAYVKDCLDTNYVSSVGSYVTRFERAIADRVGVPHAVATVTGTAALHIALLVAGVEPEDEVLVSTLTFIAPVNAIRYVGAIPVFIDAERTFWQMDPDAVREYTTTQCTWSGGVLRNRVSGRRVRAILPVHILGHPVDLEPLAQLAREYALTLIEDATESLGAAYRDRPVGSIGHLACFSFNGNKLITTGGGGMLVTANASWARRAKYLTTQAKDDAIEFVHGEVGYNYRLTNVAAALGCAQLENLDQYIDAKRRIAQTYTTAFTNVSGLTPMTEAPWGTSVWWMFTVLVDPDAFGCDSRALLHELANEGIQARPLWQPIHQSPSSPSEERRACPVADALNAMALSLPCSVGLTERDQARVIDAVLRAGRRPLEA